MTYCTKCGKQNPDDAAFCGACGAPLAVTQVPAAGAAPQAGARAFVAQLTAGEHAHIYNDVTLTDERGSVVMVAKRPSLLHESFEIYDPQGQLKGRIARKMHLTHNSFEISDQDQKVLTVFSVSNSRQRGAPPKCWLDDGSGNRQATFEFGSLMNFELVKPDGTLILEGSYSPQGGGLRQGLGDLTSRRCMVNLFDQTFSPVALVGAIASIDTGT